MSKTSSIELDQSEIWTLMRAMITLVGPRGRDELLTEFPDMDLEAFTSLVLKLNAKLMKQHQALTGL